LLLLLLLSGRNDTRHSHHRINFMLLLLLLLLLLLYWYLCLWLLLLRRGGWLRYLKIIEYIDVTMFGIGRFCESQSGHLGEVGLGDALVELVEAHLSP